MAYREIISKLKSDGALFRCQGILDCLENNATDSSVIAAISSLKSDDVIILGRKVSSYALAALDALGIETYHGDEEEVRDLIPALKSYLPS